jgi:hypothetical protein
VGSFTGISSNDTSASVQLAPLPENPTGAALIKLGLKKRPKKK